MSFELLLIGLLLIGLLMGIVFFIFLQDRLNALERRTQEALQELATAAEEDRERVIQRFVRLENSRNEPGAGLGLSLVSAVAEAHGVAPSGLPGRPPAYDLAVVMKADDGESDAVSYCVEVKRSSDAFEADVDRFRTALEIAGASAGRRSIIPRIFRACCRPTSP